MSRAHRAQSRGSDPWFFLEWCGRPNRPRSLHVWFGPLGFHFFGKPIVEWYRG